MGNLTDNISFAAIRNGDLEAYEALFRGYYPSLCVVARQMIDDDGAAEDVVQEVFIRLWEKRETYGEISNLEAFLYVAVKNRCLDFLKSRKSTVDCTRADVADREGVFRDLVIEEETYRVITAAIDALPAQSARIMRMCLDGKQNKEIAEVLNVSVNTVKTLKYKSLDVLRVTLKDYFYLLLVLLGENN